MKGVLECFKFLGPKGMSWTQGSGHMAYTCAWDELAGALGMGGLDPLAYTLGCAKYCDDAAQKKRLAACVQDWVQTQAQREKWQTRSFVLPRLASLACYEILKTPHCPTCRGSGAIALGVVCPTCEGSGYLAMSNRARYQFIGMDKRNWEPLASALSTRFLPTCWRQSVA